MKRRTLALRVLVGWGYLALGGCAQVGDHAADDAAIASAAAVAARAEPPPSEAPAMTSQVRPSTQEEPAASGADRVVADPVVEATEPSAPAVLADAAIVAPERAEPSASAADAAAAPSLVAAGELEAPKIVARSSAETLDFKALVSRLRKTKAINLSAKLSVKNLSDDLLDDFRAYHTQRGTADLGDLRRSYDSLFQRLHSLLRDADPLLDRDIDRSRAALWEILADPRKFTAANLMAGA